MEPNRVAVIFGGASGIGLATAHLCRNKVGMKLAIADIDDKALANLKAEFPDALCVKCDAADESQVKQFAEQVYAKFNDCGFLFNNTGIVRGDSAYKSRLDDWRKVMRVTFDAAVVGTSEFVPRMQQQPNKKCVIVNTSSIAGLMNSFLETGAPYTVAKHASRIYSEALALELRGGPISVHVLCPGPVNTNLLTNSRAKTETFAFEKSKGGINDEVLANALTPEHVAEQLYDGVVRRKRFYIVVTAEMTPPQVIAELMRFVADDVEYGSEVSLSYVNPTPERKKEVYKRVSQAFKRTSKL